MNDRQDSICLELRSQLVDLDLELKELVPDKTITKIVEQLNILNQRQEEDNQPSNKEQPMAGSAKKD